MIALSLLYIYRDYIEKRELGATLFVFAITGSSYAPITLLGVITYLKGWVIKNPLLPSNIFRVKFITPLILALLYLYGSLVIIYGTIAIDISFNLTNIFIINSILKAKQGLANTLIYYTIYIGITVILGLAGIIKTKLTVDEKEELEKGNLTLG
ncbi:Major facilitator superfamily domain general substrate transporter [Penicillium longicatenatum]|nr:Major facilitator superfamily domain general substrate transporter [Penicillium longicatenatum]